MDKVIALYNRGYYEEGGINRVCIFDITYYLYVYKLDVYIRY